MNNVNESLNFNEKTLSIKILLIYYIKNFEIQRKKVYDFESHVVYVLYAAIGTCGISIRKFSKWMPKTPKMK